jgi:hypothetical protein
MLRRLAPVLLPRRGARPRPPAGRGARLSTAGGTATQPPDAAGTAVVSRLFNVPQEDREGDWQERFLDCIVTASMEVDNKVTAGPDGLYYFSMKLPDASKPYPAYSLLSIFPHVLQEGAGITVSARDEEVQWVFSYGDVVNYHVNRQFYSMQVAKDVPLGGVTLAAGTKMLVGDPSEDYLPKAARRVMRSFLEANGIARPQVALVVREEAGDGTAAVSELAFAAQPGTEFPAGLLDMLRWFLPRHYLIVNFRTPLVLDSSSGDFRWSDL